MPEFSIRDITEQLEGIAFSSILEYYSSNDTLSHRGTRSATTGLDDSARCVPVIPSPQFRASWIPSMASQIN